MSRRALDALQGFREVNLFLRGIIPMLGFRTAIVTYDRLSRFAGESKYPLFKMMALAFDGIFSFSTVPLKWITLMGISLSLASIGFGLWALFVRLATDLAVPGWASTVIPMYFLGGLQLMALGIMGGYLSRIYSEAKQRPRFIIEKSVRCPPPFAQRPCWPVMAWRIRRFIWPNKLLNKRKHKELQCRNPVHSGVGCSCSQCCGVP